MFDIRRAVRPDQAPHAARRIRAEFLFASLLWLARGPVVKLPPADRGELRSVTWQMVGLTLVPGAAALAAWRQRPTRPTSRPSSSR